MMHRGPNHDAVIRHEWRTVDGRPMHARVSGSETARATVVFVHGLALSGRSMAPMLARLASICRCYAPDLPGFGLSANPSHLLNVAESADVIAAWLAAMGLEGVTLVGHSYGCQVVADCAARHPDRIGRVALLSPTMDRAARTAPRQIARWLREAPRELPMGPVLIKDTWDAGARRVTGTFRDALADRIEKKLPRVHMPALVVRGARDPIVPQRWAEEVARLLPHGRLVVVDGAAHSMNFTAPEQFAGVLVPFAAPRSVGRDERATGVQAAAR